MCGIAGILRRSGDGRGDEEAVRAALNLLEHRGRDGLHLRRSGPLTCGVTRLAVVGGPASVQPMASPDGRWLLCFNGEIYDHDRHRKELEAGGRPFETRGDTEVLLAAWERKGAAALDDLDGMFAFALWDGAERTLHLCRDPFGIKPLFLREEADRIAFASEPAALRPLCAEGWAPSSEGAMDFLTQGYCSPPGCLVDGVRALEGGERIRIAAVDGCAESRRWWTPPSPGCSSRTPDEPAATFAELFEAAVRRRLVADDGVELFLSGGVDSAAILVALAREGASSTRCHVARFADPAFDEGPRAEALARLFDLPCEVLTVESADYLEAWLENCRRPTLPVADPASITLSILGRNARRRSKVVLVGDGADELMGGYPTERADALRSWGRLLPAFLRPLVTAGARLLPERLCRPGPAYRSQAFFAACDLDAEDAHGAWRHYLPRHLASRVLGPRGMENLDEGLQAYRRAFARARAALPDAPFPLLAERADLEVWLVGNNLAKIDGATMGVNLEARVPYLDRRLAEWLLALPRPLRAPAPGAKPLIRAYLAAANLPSAWTRRPKKGFHVPLARWFRNELALPLRSIVAAEHRAYDDGLLRREGLLALLDDHRDGRADRSFALQGLVTFLVASDAIFGRSGPS